MTKATSAPRSAPAAGNAAARNAPLLLPASRRSPLPLALSVAAALSLAGGAWLITHPSQPELGQSFANQGQQHITLGTAHEPYDSFPATSGPHTAYTAPWGVSSVPIAQEVLVHSLEHGGIVISYQPKLIDAAGLQALGSVAARFPNKVVVAPNAQLTQAVALAAWTRLYKLDKVDLSLVTEFIGRYKDHAPEFFPD